MIRNNINTSGRVIGRRQGIVMEGNGDFQIIAEGQRLSGPFVYGGAGE